MSVYKRGGVYYYNFTYRGVRHAGSTGLTTREAAAAVEAERRRTLRLQAAGLLPPDAMSPRFSEWAEVHFRQVTPRLSRPEALEAALAVVLRFWGAAPADPATREPHAPYHDLRLADPIRDPMWIAYFETWMAGRGGAAQTRNHYRSAMRGLYRTALLPQYRAVTGITVNPFRDVPQERVVPRDVTVTVEELRRWVSHASYHVRLAVAIAALAPKLRYASILRLRWDTHVDPRLEWLTVAEHKTAGRTGRPQVVPISDQLREILEDARRRARRSPWIITYRGRPVRSIRDGVRGAAEAAGLTYGRAVGVTFHTLRHSVATWLAELGEPEKARAEALGHADIGTTQRYTHLRPVHQRGTHERLAKIVAIRDLVTHPQVRAVRPKRRGA